VTTDVTAAGGGVGVGDAVGPAGLPPQPVKPTARTAAEAQEQDKRNHLGMTRLLSTTWGVARLATRRSGSGRSRATRTFVEARIVK
jgi:hypothetical protein